MKNFSLTLNHCKEGRQYPPLQFGGENGRSEEKRYKKGLSLIVSFFEGRALGTCSEPYGNPMGTMSKEGQMEAGRTSNGHRSDSGRTSIGHVTDINRTCDGHVTDMCATSTGEVNFANFAKFANFATSYFARVAALLLMILTLGVGEVWGETMTIDCDSRTTDAVFPVGVNPTQFTYSSNSNIATWKLIKVDSDGTITITNKTGATITAISVSGVADNNANKSTTVKISDGTTELSTGSSSWNSRGSTSMTTNNFSNVAKLKFSKGTTYTITNTGYNVGLKLTITYTPAAPATKTIYFVNKDGWANVYCHNWGAGGTTWPGTQMTNTGETVDGKGVYSVELNSAENANCIFNNGSGSQTGDLEIPDDKSYYYDNGDCSDHWYVDLEAVRAVAPKSHTFHSGETWYFDFTEISGGANWPNSSNTGTEYNVNAGGSVESITFSKDVTINLNSTWDKFKTATGSWANIWTPVPTAGQNCFRVSSEGNCAIATSYLPIYNIYVEGRFGVSDGAGNMTYTGGNAGDWSTSSTSIKFQHVEGYIYKLETHRTIAELAAQAGGYNQYFHFKEGTTEYGDKSDSGNSNPPSTEPGESNVATCDRNFIFSTGSGDDVVLWLDWENKKFWYSCTTSEVPVTSITVVASSYDIKQGETATITATILPDNATDKSITWSSPKNSSSQPYFTFDNANENPATFTTKMPTGGQDITCTAANGVSATTSSKIRVYRLVEFESNGGSVCAPEKYYKDNITLPSPTKTSYIFEGWYTNEGLTNKAGDAGASYKPNNNITLYAKWTPKEYSVTLDKNGGDTDGSATARFGQKSFVNAGSGGITLPTRANYHVYGAFYSSTTLTQENLVAHKDGTFVEKATAYTDASGAWNWDGVGSVVLYTRWVHDNVSVTLDQTGADTESRSKTIAMSFEDKVLSTSANGDYVPSRNHYDFAGYYTLAEGGVQIMTATGAWIHNVDGFIDAEGHWLIEANTTIYPRWTLRQNTITYDVNGGTGSIDNQVYTWGGKAPVIASGSSLTRTGYTFAGWKDAQDNSYTPGADWVHTDKTETITLIAQWTPIVTTIIVRQNYGDADPETFTLKVPYDGAIGDVKVVIDAVEYTLSYKTELLTNRTGYSHNGFYAAESSGSFLIKYDNSTSAWKFQNVEDYITSLRWSYTGASPLTLYSHWTAKKTNVTFDSQGAQSSGTTSNTATYGQPMQKITLPTKTGYYFAGYFDQKGGAGNQYYAADGKSLRNWDKEAFDAKLYAYWVVQEVPCASATMNTPNALSDVTQNGLVLTDVGTSSLDYNSNGIKFTNPTSALKLKLIGATFVEGTRLRIFYKNSSKSGTNTGLAFYDSQKGNKKELFAATDITSGSNGNVTYTILSTDNAYKGNSTIIIDRNGGAGILNISRIEVYDCGPAPEWKIAGPITDNEWNTVPMSGSDDAYYYQRELTAANYYDFKVVKSVEGLSDMWYTMTVVSPATRTITEAECQDIAFKELGGEGNNTTLTTTRAGLYRVNVNTEDDYPVVTVAYPVPTTYYVYLGQTLVLPEGHTYSKGASAPAKYATQLTPSVETDIYADGNSLEGNVYTANTLGMYTLRADGATNITVYVYRYYAKHPWSSCESTQNELHNKSWVWRAMAYADNKATVIGEYGTVLNLTSPSNTGANLAWDYSFDWDGIYQLNGNESGDIQPHENEKTTWWADLTTATTTGDALWKQMELSEMSCGVTMIKFTYNDAHAISTTAPSMTEGQFVGENAGSVNTHALTFAAVPKAGGEVSSDWGASSPVKVKHGESATINAVANEGYVFTGWYDNKECTGEPVCETAKYSIASVTVPVKAYAKFEKVVTAITITAPNDAHSLQAHETLQLSVVYEPADATVGNEISSWVSSNETYLSVSDDGLVTANAAGTGHYITATTTNGVSATYYINVVGADCAGTWSVHMWNTGGTHTRACMYEYNADNHEWRSDIVTLPSFSDAEKLKVLYDGDAQEHSAEWSTRWLPMIGKQANSSVDQIYPGQDAEGYFRIYNNSGEPNYYLAFQPTYVLMYGVHDQAGWVQTEFNEPASGHEYHTNVVKVPTNYFSTADFNCYVGTKRANSTAPFVGGHDGREPRSEEFLMRNMTGLTSDLGGHYGYYKIFDNYTDKNWYVSFVEAYAYEMRNEDESVIYVATSEAADAVALYNGEGSAALPVKDGFELIGWSRSKDQTVAEYELGDAYTFSSSLDVLYPVWKELCHPTGLTYDFECWDVEPLAGNKEQDGVTAYAKEGSPVDIKRLGSLTEIDGVSFNHVLDLRGQGDCTKGAPYRIITFDVDGPCAIDVYLKSSSSSAARTLNLYSTNDVSSWQRSNTPLCGFSAEASDASKETYNYPYGAATIVLCSTSGGIYVYGIDVKPLDSWSMWRNGLKVDDFTKVDENTFTLSGYELKDDNRTQTIVFKNNGNSYSVTDAYKDIKTKTALALDASAFHMDCPNGTYDITITKEGGTWYVKASAAAPVEKCGEIIKVVLSGDNGSTQTVTGTIGGTSAVNALGKSAPYKLNSTGAYVTLTLADGNYFQNGDVLTIEGADKAHQVYTGDIVGGTGVWLATTSAPTAGTISYTLSGVPANTTTIGVYRAGGDYNGRLTSMTVERECGNMCTTPILNALTPAPQTVCVGSDAESWTASVSNQAAITTAGETVTYTWTHGGSQVATGATLSLTNVNLSMGGTYTVTATVSKAGYKDATASTTATLNVPNPTISQADELDEIKVGETLTLTAAAGGEWSSEQPGVATVNASGDVTGVAAGTATITYTLDGCTATYTVTVEAVVSDPVFTWKNGEATFTSGSLTLSAGGYYNISVVSTGTETPVISLTPVAGVTFTPDPSDASRGTLYITPACESDEIVLTATSVANVSFSAKTENVTINVENCGSSEITSAGKIPMAASTDKGGGSEPRYVTENSYGWLAAKTGTSAFGTEPADFADFTARYSSNGKTYTFSNAMDNVAAVRLYLHTGSNKTTVASVYQSNEYFSSTSNATEVSVVSTYFNAAGEKTGANMPSSGTNYSVMVGFPTLLSANTVTQINFNYGVRVYGIEFYTAQDMDATAKRTTTLGWDEDLSGGVTKTTADMPFQHVAAATGENRNTLGAVTYKSSNTSVATVSSTGTVTIVGEGSTTITATLAASGCYHKATASYNLTVTQASITDPTDVIVTTTSEYTNKCPSAEVTMTAAYESGVEIPGGATYQWYKDNKTIGDATGKSYETADEGTYTVVVHINNDIKSTNSIKITNRATATVRALYDYWYIKQGRKTPDLAVFEIDDPSGTAVVTLPANAAGKYSFRRDGDVVYLSGTAPTEITAEKNVTATITVNDGCDDVEASIELRLKPVTGTPELAFVTANDAHLNDEDWTTCLASQTTALSLYTELSSAYTIQATNIYASNNEAKVRAFYSQFDILLITDFPNTKKVAVKGQDYKTQGFVNALGSLVDIRPILTMEAFVSALENWQTKGDPKNTAVQQFDMLLMCQTHEIFAGTHYDMENIEGVDYYKVNMVNSEGFPAATQAVQGFAASDLGEMVVIGKTHDVAHSDSETNSDLLMACVERQVVADARMMVLGVNANSLPYLTNDGETIIKNSLAYLLKDGKDISDCALIFDNGAGNDDSEATKGDHQWNNPENWGPNYNSLPIATNEVRIIADCTVPNGVFPHVAYAKIKDGVTLTISDGAALTVDGMVRMVNGTNYMETEDTKASQIRIESSATGNGALIHNDASGQTNATVQMYSPASGAPNPGLTWQWMTTPFNHVDAAETNYLWSWMREYNSGSHTWVDMHNGSSMEAFGGYEITQASPITYTMTGQLASTKDRVIALQQGLNVIGNSWTAPINIGQFKESDFNGAEKTIVMLNTGLDVDGSGAVTNYAGGTIESEDVRTPGTYVSIPIHVAGNLKSALQVIPSMQAFQVRTNKGEENGMKLILHYDQLVRPKSGNVNIQPMRAPSRKAGIENEQMESLRIYVKGSHYGDYLYIFRNEETTMGFDNGWDGRKYMTTDNTAIPALIVRADNLNWQISTQPQFSGTQLGFYQGEDTTYTMGFTYQGGERLWLYDSNTDNYTLVHNDSTYTFTSTSGRKMQSRFVLTDYNPYYVEPVIPEIPDEPSDPIVTELTHVTVDGNMLTFTNATHKPMSIAVYDAAGKLVTRTTTEAPLYQVELSDVQGVYMVHMSAGDKKIVTKVVR